MVNGEYLVCSLLEGIVKSLMCPKSSWLSLLLVVFTKVDQIEEYRELKASAFNVTYCLTYYARVLQAGLSPVGVAISTRS